MFNILNGINDIEKIKYSIIVILVMAIVIAFTRMFPYFALDRGGDLPDFVRFLGKYLPPAVMSFLIIYCIKNVNLLEGSHGIPEFIGILTAGILHFVKGNVFLSIVASTVLYMFLIQVVF